MTINNTTLLGLALPVTGTEGGTWGDTVNTSITSLLDSAIAGTTTLSTDASVTLSSTVLAANEARQAILLCTGARTGITTITAPARSKTYTVINATTGGFSVVIRGGGSPPTTGVTIVAGESAVIAWNGLDFVKVSSNSSLGALTVTSLTDTGLTSTRVTYAGASGLLQDSANMTFNGTVLTSSFAGPVAATTLSASSTVSGTGFSTYLASPPAIGGTAAAAGAFTTLSASSTVSGTGFSTYLASPPAIGGTTAAGGAFTTLSASSTVGGTGFSTYLASPPAIGGTAAAAGAFTTLSASNTIRGTSTTITGSAGGAITPTSDTTNQYTITALGAAAIFAVPSGTPVDGQKLILRIKDNGTAWGLTWTTTAGGYRVVGTVLPTTTTISKVLYVGCVYNSQDTFWDVVAVIAQA